MSFEIGFCGVAASFLEDQCSKSQEAELIHVDFCVLFTAVTAGFVSL